MSGLPYKSLGEAGEAWVRNSLTSERPWAISRRVLEGGRLADGSVLGLGVPPRADLPADVKLQYAPETYGFSLTQATSGDVLLPLFDRIERRYGPCFLVIEADLLKPDDPYVRELPPGSVVADGEGLYHIEPLADATDAEHSIVLFNSVAVGYPVVAFILWKTTPEEISDAFRQHKVDALGDRVIAIINSIFDDDGYSIWLPDSIRAALLSQEGD